MEQSRNQFAPGAATDEPVPSFHLATEAEADVYRAGIAEGLRRARGGEAPPQVPDFDPVPLRYRRDGWTPERQVAFIRALAECGCVVEACRRVGMSAESAYALARRPDAQSFRIAWDIAMDNSVRRVGDAAFSRALNGVEIPHYYKGELVGTHRRWDERLTMFILRTRDRERCGRRGEAAEPLHSREGRALDLADMLAWVKNDAEREAQGLPRRVHPHLGADYGEEGDEEGGRRRDLRRIYAFAPRPPGETDETDADPEALEIERRCDAISDDEAEAQLAGIEAELRALLAGEDADEDGAGAAFPPDVPRPSSTSADPSFPSKREPGAASPKESVEGEAALDARLGGDDGEGDDRC